MFCVVRDLADCELCGSPVRISGARGVCRSCGAEYDVIRHGRRADFGTSSQLSVGAKMYSTSERIYLGPSPMPPGVSPYPPGTVLYVGTEITIRIGVLSVDEGSFRATKNIDGSLQSNCIFIWHKIDAGAWEKIWTGNIAVDGTIDRPYTITKSGTHTFYLEFTGTDKYAGCAGGVDAKVVSGDYGSSEQVSVNAQAALTVAVNDLITRKPVVGAKVVVDTTESVTGDSGIAVYDTLTPGIYTLTVEARDYKSETRMVQFTAAGKLEEVYLLPLWAIAAGVIGVGAVGVVAAVKLRRG